MAGDEFAIRVARLEDAAGLRRLIEESVRGLQAGDYSLAPAIPRSGR